MKLRDVANELPALLNALSASELGEDTWEAIMDRERELEIVSRGLEAVLAEFELLEVKYWYTVPKRLPKLISFIWVPLGPSAQQTSDLEGATTDQSLSA